MYVVMYILAAGPFLEFAEKCGRILSSVGPGITGKILVEYTQYTKIK